MAAGRSGAISIIFIGLAIRLDENKLPMILVKLVPCHSRESLLRIGTESSKPESR
jgi:hypothetical protein